MLPGFQELNLQTFFDDICQNLLTSSNVPRIILTNSQGLFWNLFRIERRAFILKIYRLLNPNKKLVKSDQDLKTSIFGGVGRRLLPPIGS